MDLHVTLADLTKHVLFKEWHSSNPNYFLAHAFVMLDEENKDTWQIGFYNAEKERMVTFIVSPNNVQKTEDQEILSSGTPIQRLLPEKVMLTVDDALQKAKACYDEHYKAEITVKQFFIIQTGKSCTMFNITYFTRAMKTINIKIDASTGQVFKHSSQTLAEFT